MQARPLQSALAAVAGLLLAAHASAAALPHAGLDPVFVPGTGPRTPPARGVGRGAAPLEWVLHRSADGAHPDPEEQELVWLMNRARLDPTAEGLWLASAGDPAIASGRIFFGVDTPLLADEFAALAPTPPAAFDRRLYEAALAHSLDLIDRDAQDHTGQLAAVDASGFDHAGGRMSVFSYASSALNAHAAFNIDWGPGDGTGMQPGRGHRAAIMGDAPNVGIACPPETDPGTSVGELVVSANYFWADTSSPDHYNRFLVGTVWEDLDLDGAFDAGEGLPGVTVTPDSGPWYAVTSEGGGYAIPVELAGSYAVTFSGGDLPGPFLRNVAVGASSELLDLLAVPEPGGTKLLGVGAALLLASARRSARLRAGAGPPRSCRGARRGGRAAG